jgi:hypothetical protein
MITLGVFVLWQLLLAWGAGVENPRTVSALVLPGSTAMYVFGSAVVLGLRHPLRWLFGVAAVIAFVPYVNESLEDRPNRFVDLRPLISAIERGMPLIFAVGLAAGLIALWAALSRHSEQRRH